MGCLEAQLQCPYCWEMLEVLIEPEPAEQQYVEDCQVCCAPILISVTVMDDAVISLSAERENG